MGEAVRPAGREGTGGASSKRERERVAEWSEWSEFDRTRVKKLLTDEEEGELGGESWGKERGELDVEGEDGVEVVWLKAGRRVGEALMPEACENR